MDGLVGKNRLKDIWKRIFSAMKMITGDVDFKNDGTLQEQILTFNKKLDEKLGKTEDSKDLTTTYDSGDSTNATAWTDVGVLTSGEKHSSMLQKVSTMFKNIRYLYHMLGTADISTLGEGADIGTVTGALSKLNSDVDNINNSNLTNYTVGLNISYEQLLLRTTPTFFTNWHDVENFPDVYGSGLIMTGFDYKSQYIIYFLTNSVYVKTKFAGTWGQWVELARL